MSGSDEIVGDLPGKDQTEYILAELCSKAPDNEIRDCLRRYNKELPLRHLHAAFMVPLKKVLAKTAKYLKLNPDANKPVLSHNIICRIQNLLPDKCHLCGEIYASKLDDKPFLACSLCGQEVHRCCIMDLVGITDDSSGLDINPYRIPGIHYLCHPCEEKLIPRDDSPEAYALNDEPHMMESTISVHTDVGDTGVSTSSSVTASSLSILNEDTSLEVQQLPTAITSLVQETSTPPNTANASVPKMSTGPNTEVPGVTNVKNVVDMLPNDSTEQDLVQDNTKKKKICIHYKRNQCQFGMKGKGCAFYHPEKCKKLMAHGNKMPKGCNLGQKCSSFHPKMCPSSITKLECFDDKCIFCHVKGTKRKKHINETKFPKKAPDHTTSSSSSSKTSSTPKTTMSNTQQATTTHDKSAAVEIMDKASFLEIIRLLKEELKEAMDVKIATALSQLPQYHPPQMMYPQFQHQQPHQFYPLMVPQMIQSQATAKQPTSQSQV